MARKMNALDWFHEAYCSRCDVPNSECEKGSGPEIACILAHILKAVEEK